MHAFLRPRSGRLRCARPWVCVGSRTLGSASTPFNLTEGPLVRFGVEGSRVTMCVHHAIWDGRSTKIFAERLYSRDGTPNAKRSVSDYAAWEANNPIRTDIEFWKRILRDTPPKFALPAEREDFSETVIHITPQIVRDLEMRCRDARISLHTAIVGAFQCVLCSYASQNRFAVGVTHDARPPQCTHACGNFANTVLYPMELCRESLSNLNARIATLRQHHRDNVDELVRLGYGTNINISNNLEFAPVSLSDKSVFERSLAENMEGAMFDLGTWWVRAIGGGWAVLVKCNGGVWHRLGDRICHVLRHVGSTGDLPDTSLLPEEATALRLWSVGRVQPLSASCVHTLFEDQAAETPDDVALVCGSIQMTYQAVNTRTDILASCLQSKGVSPETLVGLVQHRSAELIIALLGILKAGGAYVPIDPSWPEARVEFVVQDAGLNFMVTPLDFATLPVRARIAVCVCLLGNFGKRGEIQSKQNAENCDALAPDLTVNPNNLVYMVFTSGSTGKPKGVLVEHASVANNARHVAQLLVETKHRVLFTTSVCFDAHVDETWSVWAAGGCCVVDDVGRLGSLDDSITLVNATPCVLQNILAKRSAWPAIRTALVGGDVMAFSELHALRQQCPSATLLNCYGPTETTNEASMWRDDGGDKVLVGRPISNVKCFVVGGRDIGLKIAGVDGELWIGGVGVARGYHDRPVLTADKFVPNPFGEGQVYKSGDLVRWNAEGELEFIGRIDHQVKVRGFRVELGEVEAALQRLEGVRSAACVMRDSALIGYVAPAEGLDVEALKATLASSLPAYMMPSVVMALKVLPLTTNGKVDRNALPDPELNHAKYVAPRTPAEAALCAVFADMLGELRVGVHDDFFALGGHSLLAMRAARETGYSMAQLLAHPSAAALAELERDADLLQRHPESTRATGAERRLVYLQLAEPASMAYHVPFEWTFEAGVDVHANLRHAIVATPVLSVCFTAEGKAVDGLPPSVVEGRANALSPFDLQTGPVARFGIEGQTLTACVHHAVFDGRSIVLFLRRVVDPVGAPRDTFTVRDYAEHEAARPADVGFWRSAVPEVPRFAPPVTDEGAPAWRSGLRVPASLASRARAACASRTVSSFVFVLGAVHRVLRAYASQALWAIGVAFDARPPELQHTCGMFVNTVLVPFEAAVAESLEALRDRWVGKLLPRARDPYHEVVSAVGGECNVLLACNLGMGFGDAQSVGYDDKEEKGRVTSQFDLSLSFEDDLDGGWLIGVDSGVGEWPRLTERLTHVVSVMVEASDDDAAVSGLLLPGEETTLLEWGTGLCTTVPTLCVHELFEAQAARTPEAVALVFGNAEMTYAELLRRTSALGAHLQGHGVDQGVLVGLLLQRSFGLVVGMVAVLRAGGAYVPLETSHPKTRVCMILEDSGARVVVTTTVLQRANVGIANHCVCLDTFEDGPVSLVPSPCSPTNLAYMIYTSGSTGKPKGCEIEHGGVVNNMLWMLPKFHALRRTVRMLFTTSLCSDPHVYESWTVLASGGTVVIVADTLSLAERQDWTANALNSTPSFLAELAPSISSHVELVFVGGEALLAQHVNRIRSSFVSIKIVNCYGPTECTIDCLWHEVEVRVGHRDVPIGKPLPNFSCYVVGSSEALVPLGIAGELWIGGVGVARGYHDRPTLTATKFIPDPFGSPGGRVYKTGDLVRWNIKGELEFIGRIDHQVKVRGFRVELGEVEAALQRLEGVRGAVCVVSDGVLVGYVVAPAEPDESAVKRSLASTLPAYMVPSMIVKLAALPLTANDKVDRNALPDPELQRVEYVAPRTPSEATLCAVFEQVLGAARVGVHDDFFALGGHSLLAMRASRETGFSVAQLLAHPSVAALAELERESDRLQCRPESTRTTDAERRLVYLQLAEPASVAYHVPFEWTFDENVEVLANLQRAIAATPVLSVRFTTEGEAVDGSPPPIVEGRADALSPFDLETGPVARFGVEGQTLTACVRHAVFDGRSIVLFLRRVADPAGAPSDAFTVRDYAEHEAARPADVGFWRCVMSEVPHFSPPVANEGASAWRSWLRVPASLVSRARGTCASRGLSSFVFVLGAVHRVMRAYASQASWAIGVVFDARPPELQHTCGMFVNTVLVPFEAAVVESLEALRDRWVGKLLPRAHDPYHEVVSAVGGECNVLLVCELGMDFGDVPSVDHEEKGPLAPKFDLSLSFADDADGGWLVSMESGVGEWPRLTERVAHVVGAMASDDDDGAVVTGLLLAGEETTLLEWGTGPSTAVPALCVHELFEAQAARTPEAVALVFGEVEMTYGELKKRVASLASHLQDCMGVGPDVLVGLLMDRGFDLVVGMLGILLAGGAYVPIDPSYPEERIDFVLSDARITTVVTLTSLVRGSGVYRNVCLDIELPASGDSTKSTFCSLVPQDLAYTIYTSGSTGQPKGARVTHGGVVNLIVWAGGHIQASCGGVSVRRMYATTTASFDISNLEFYVPLIFGWECVVVGRPEDCGEAYQQRGAGIVQFTPTVWGALYNTKLAPQLLLCGGEAVPRALVASLSTQDFPATNVYGPTETTIWSTFAPMVAGVPHNAIGRPIANTLCYVVSSPTNTNALAPPGVVGELCISGLGVARGYHDRPALTAAKFLPDPFGGPGGRIYKTGDLVRWNSDGELEFIGRVDHQVKVRGFRVELGEVEAALQRLEDVRGAACVVRDGALVGYVAPAELDAAGLKTSLASALPAYMVPSVVVALEALPLTANGKLDRKSLPEPEFKPAECVAPRTPNEAALCAVFEQVLDADLVGVHDDFFALGGHSLLAVKIVNNLRKSLCARVSVRDLLECTTPAQIAMRIQAMETGETAAVVEGEGMIISLRRSRGTLRPS